MIARAVHFRRADLDEALQPVALHQLFRQTRERHGIRFEETPGVLPRYGAFALGGEVDDDFRLLLVEKLEQEVELVGDVARVVFVALAPLDAERERLRPQRIASNADDLLGFGMVEEIHGGVDAKAAAASENAPSLRHYEQSN